MPKAFNQIVYVPFSGTGSEVVGIIKAGIDPKNIISVEINPDFCQIQKARVEYHNKVEVSLPKEPSGQELQAKTKPIQNLLF